MYGISFVVILLRLVAKLRIQLRLGIDDGLMILALLLGIGNFAFDTAGVRYGLGRHFFYLTPFERVNSMKNEFLGQPIGKHCKALIVFTIKEFVSSLPMTSLPKQALVSEIARSRLLGLRHLLVKWNWYVFKHLMSFIN